MRTREQLLACADKWLERTEVASTSPAEKEAHARLATAYVLLAKEMRVEKEA
jgi:hypothetical protein